MPCGKYRRDQFASQADYEAHRAKMLKLILGDGWQDKSLSQLVYEHPELQRLSLPALIHQADHLERQQAVGPWTAEVITDPHELAHDEVLAIEGGTHMTAEDWLRQYQRADVPED